MINMHSAMVACRHQNKAQAGVGTAAKGFGREVDRYPYLGKLGTRWDVFLFGSRDETAKSEYIKV